MPVHHLMIGTWTPPGAIFTVAFDDEKLTLELVKRTEIPHDEPISWMSFDVSPMAVYGRLIDLDVPGIVPERPHVVAEQEHVGSDIVSGPILRVRHG